MGGYLYLHPRPEGLMLTNEQLNLIKRLYEAHRSAWSENNRVFGYVEVGAINGVNPRTAQALVNNGLAVYDAHPTSDQNNTYIRLPLPLPGEGEYAQRNWGKET
jgi:hypothetical protein